MKPNILTLMLDEDTTQALITALGRALNTWTEPPPSLEPLKGTLQNALEAHRKGVQAPKI